MKRRISPSACLSAALATALLASCQVSNPGTAPQSARTVGTKANGADVAATTTDDGLVINSIAGMKVKASEGAVITAPDGDLSITIPPGALSKDATVAISKYDTTGNDPTVYDDGTMAIPGISFKMSLGGAMLKTDAKVTVTANVDPRWVDVAKCVSLFGKDGSGKGTFDPTEWGLSQGANGQQRLSMAVSGPASQEPAAPPDPLSPLSLRAEFGPSLQDNAAAAADAQKVAAAKSKAYRVEGITQAQVNTISNNPYAAALERQRRYNCDNLVMHACNDTENAGLVHTISAVGSYFFNMWGGDWHRMDAYFKTGGNEQAAWNALFSAVRAGTNLCITPPPPKKPPVGPPPPPPPKLPVPTSGPITLTWASNDGQVNGRPAESGQASKQYSYWNEMRYQPATCVDAKGVSYNCSYWYVYKVHKYLFVQSYTTNFPETGYTSGQTWGKTEITNGEPPISLTIPKNKPTVSVQGQPQGGSQQYAGTNVSIDVSVSGRGGVQNFTGTSLNYDFSPSLFPNPDAGQVGLAAKSFQPTPTTWTDIEANPGITCMWNGNPFGPYTLPYNVWFSGQANAHVVYQSNDDDPALPADERPTANLWDHKDVANATVDFGHAVSAAPQRTPGHDIKHFDGVNGNQMAWGLNDGKPYSATGQQTANSIQLSGSASYQVNDSFDLNLNAKLPELKFRIIGETNPAGKALFNMDYMLDGQKKTMAVPAARADGYVHLYLPVEDALNNQKSHSFQMMRMFSTDLQYTIKVSDGGLVGPIKNVWRGYSFNYPDLTSIVFAPV